MKTFQQFQEGLLKKALITTALATPFLAKKFLKPKTDKMLDTQRKTNKIGGDKRSGNTDFQKGVNALKDAKKGGGLMNKSTKDALKMLDNY